MFHEIQLGNKKTYTDWGLLPVQQPVFNPPAVKTKILDIPGGDGIIDLTEAIAGYPAFKNREGTWNFIAVKGSKDFYPIYDELIHYLHGQTMQVRLPDDDPGWYFEGRFWVNTMACNRLRGLIAINYSVGPYKWSDRLTDEPWIWDTFNFNTGVIGSATYWDESTDPPTLVYTGYGDAYGHIPVTNTAEPLEFAQSGSAPVQPVFSVTGGHSVVVKIGTDTKTIAAGASASIPGLVLYHGIWLYYGREKSVTIAAGAADPSASATKTISGDIVTFSDGASGTHVSSLKTALEPVQSGSGDPSPTNVRPITGMSSVDIRVTGKNVWGGTDFRDDILAKIEGASADDTAKTVTYAPNKSSGAVLFTGFKENTKYTFIFTYSGTQSRSNLQVQYTDGTTDPIPSISGTAKATVVFVSDTGKTIESVKKTYSGGNTTVYYDETGVFEGVLTGNDFVPYIGSSYSTAFSDAVWGGEFDAVSGILTKTAEEIESYDGETLPGAWISDRDVYVAGATPTTGAQVVYELATPVTVQLTAQQTTILTGENNIWADRGMVSVTYAVDTPSTLAVKFREGRL